MHITHEQKQNVQEIERRRIRRDVKEIFVSVDADKSGKFLPLASVGPRVAEILFLHP